MTIVRVGATQNYSEGWAIAFSKGKGAKTATKAATKVKAVASPKAKKAGKKAKKK